MTLWQEVKPEELQRNPFHAIGTQWMVVAAQKEGKINMMTASWGGFGIMWGKNVAYVVIRPQRYTKEFIDASEGFSLTFFDDIPRKTLNYLGTVSGRNEDKLQKSGLTAVFSEDIPYFEEANVAIFCKKLFQQQMAPESFLDPDLIDKWYPNRDFHTLYIAEITKILVK